MKDKQEDVVNILVETAYTIGWLIFLYLGGAGVYELVGGRRYRASLLLAAAFLWIVLTFVFFHYTGQSSFGVVMAVLYFVACVFLVRKVHTDLGTPDIR
ncbi:MAG: hypothetical protein ABL931_10380 [Usitatibacteraceae bacterium]